MTTTGRYAEPSSIVISNDVPSHCYRHKAVYDRTQSNGGAAGIRGPDRNAADGCHMPGKDAGGDGHTPQGRDHNREVDGRPNSADGCSDVHSYR